MNTASTRTWRAVATVLASWIAAASLVCVAVNAPHASACGKVEVNIAAL
ncbi:MAG: hypothetical protein JNJ55_07915 [Betaproteobacteria bacterium]|nr:hypothetical protein [Betaproteobacteria bacterium]